MKRDDVFTRFFCQALNLLFLSYPLRSSIGVLFAVLTYLAFDAFPVLIELTRASNNASARYFFSLVGYLLVHAKTIVEGVNGNALPEDVMQAINLIERSNLSEQQKRIHYSETITRHIKTLGQKGLTEALEETESS